MSIEIYIMKKKMNIYIFPINHELNGKKRKKNSNIKNLLKPYLSIYIFFA